MKYSVDRNERYCVFTVLEKNLNSVSAPDFKSELILLSNNDINNFILDLQHVEYIDSSGLSCILTGNRLWKRRGSFVLSGANHPSVKKLIEISRLNTILPVVPTVEESIDYVMMEELQRELQGTEEETPEE